MDKRGFFSHVIVTHGTNCVSPSFLRLISVTWNLYEQVSLSLPSISFPVNYNTLPTCDCRRINTALTRFGFVTTCGFNGFFLGFEIFLTFTYAATDWTCVGLREDGGFNEHGTSNDNGIWLNDNSVGSPCRPARRHARGQYRMDMPSSSYTVLAHMWCVRSPQTEHGVVWRSRSSTKVQLATAQRATCSRESRSANELQLTNPLPFLVWNFEWSEFFWVFKTKSSWLKYTFIFSKMDLGGPATFLKSMPLCKRWLGHFSYFLKISWILYILKIKRVAQPPFSSKKSVWSTLPPVQG